MVRDIEDGRLDAWTSELAIAEVVFVLESKKHYHQSRQSIAEALLVLLSLPHLKLAHKKLHRRVFHLYTTYPKLSYVDCYHAAFVEAHQMAPELYSYDTDFDQLTTIIRLQPTVSQRSEEKAA